MYLVFRYLKLPEKNVSCTFRIANVSTSDLTHDVKLNYPKIDELNSEVVIFIYPGDAFVRFSKVKKDLQILNADVFKFFCCNFHSHPIV